MQLTLLFAESALELVPKEIWRSPAVVADSRRRGKDPSMMLLDRSFHHSAMAKLPDSEKRGRPDLVHVALLSVTGTPLYLDGRVRVLVHTYPDVVLELEKKTRIPKSYFRFRGLVEKVLSEKPGNGLVRVRQKDVAHLLKEDIAPGMVFGLSVQGRMTPLDGLAKEIVDSEDPIILIGGFPHGHFSEKTLRLISKLVRIDLRPLEAHVVASRLVYEIEKALA